MSNFYGTEIKILAGFWPVYDNEKKIDADYEQLLRAVFSCFMGKKSIVIFGLKSFILK